MTVTATEIDTMRAGAAEFLRGPLPDVLDAELRTLTAPAPDRIPPERRMHWKTIEAGHATC